jgi:DNA-directed RNA polymerase specialized sigma24 family protein
MFAHPDFEELERRVATRDRTAFNELQRAYFSLLETFIISKTNDPRSSRDFTRRIFQLAWKRIDRYPWRDYSFHVWLQRIAREELEGGMPANAETEESDDEDF